MSWPKFIVSLVLPQLAGLIGLAANNEATWAWYDSLVKPLYTPPDATFGIVWPLLYLMMGVSLYLVWTGEGSNKRLSLAIFDIQLVLNALWSLVFFGMHNPGGALIVIVLLWLSIITNIILFWRISRPAALLLAPYLLWVSFAAYLNYAINIIN